MKSITVETDKGSEFDFVYFTPFPFWRTEFRIQGLLARVKPFAEARLWELEASDSTCKPWTYLKRG